MLWKGSERSFAAEKGHGTLFALSTLRIGKSEELLGKIRVGPAWAELLVVPPGQARAETPPPGSAHLLRCSRWPSKHSTFTCSLWSLTAIYIPLAAFLGCVSVNRLCPRAAHPLSPTTPVPGHAPTKQAASILPPAYSPLWGLGISHPAGNPLLVHRAPTWAQKPSCFPWTRERNFSQAGGRLYLYI